MKVRKLARELDNLDQELDIIIVAYDDTNLKGGEVANIRDTGFDPSLNTVVLYIEAFDD